ncbi:unnamed protein product, partial [Meganyctiphanes norvegica]
MAAILKSNQNWSIEKYFFSICNSYFWNYEDCLFYSKQVLKRKYELKESPQKHFEYKHRISGHFEHHMNIVFPVLELKKHHLPFSSYLRCLKCNSLISENVHVEISASSQVSWRRRKSCQPHDAAINSHQAWCARKNNDHEWLQWDLGPPHVVTGIVTRGRGDTGRKHWVLSYYLTYSNDSNLWFTYKDGNHLDTKVFGGNLDKHTERRHYLNTPFTARFVRLHPKRWHKAIALRAALMGCPHKGDCGEGFFRITKDTPCEHHIGFLNSIFPYASLLRITCIMMQHKVLGFLRVIHIVSRVTNYFSSVRY